MSNTTRLIRSGLAALAIVTAVTATTQVLFAQVAIAKEHRDHREKAHETSSRDTTKDSTGHEREHNSRG